MEYRRFLIYNVAGGLAWVCIMTIGGYLFGNVPFVKRKFGLVTIAIILLSMLPLVTELLKARRARRRQSA